MTPIHLITMKEVGIDLVPFCGTNTHQGIKHGRFHMSFGAPCPLNIYVTEGKKKKRKKKRLVSETFGKKAKCCVIFYFLFQLSKK